jgi:hypothetical protein
MVNSDLLAGLATEWFGAASSAESRGQRSDAAGEIGMGAYWLGRADALRDAARELAEVTPAEPTMLEF